MTEEKANQIIRCVKECWWRVGLLLLLVFCFVLTLIHGWPSGDWGLGWGAVGALSAMAIGCIALKVSATQNRWIADKREHDLHMLRTRAKDVSLFLRMSITYYLVDSRGTDGALETLIRNVKEQHIIFEKVVNAESLYLLGNDVINVAIELNKQLELSVLMTNVFYNGDDLKEDDLLLGTLSKLSQKCLLMLDALGESIDELEFLKEADKSRRDMFTRYGQPAEF